MIRAASARNGRTLLMPLDNRGSPWTLSELSPVGLDRAQKLGPYILATFGKPHFLFASAFLTRHAEKPDIPIDTTHADQDYAALANHLLTKDDFKGGCLSSAGTMVAFRSLPRL
jgi:hypothetical protein